MDSISPLLPSSPHPHYRREVLDDVQCTLNDSAAVWSLLLPQNDLTGTLMINISQWNVVHVYMLHDVDISPVMFYTCSMMLTLMRRDFPLSCGVRDRSCRRQASMS